MSRPRALDLCCKEGGASKGYHLAGFDMTGVDINPQPRYPFTFIQADAFEYVRAHGHEYELITASWLCRRYTKAQKIRGNEHPDQIGPGREAIQATGVPYVLENVPGAPLIDPIELCGCMFDGLNVYRERWFESNIALIQPLHQMHVEPQVKMGRPPRPGHRMHVVGNFSGVAEAREAMGIDWMSRDGLRDAIPPAYTQFIGEQLLAAIRSEVAA